MPCSLIGNLSSTPVESRCLSLHVLHRNLNVIATPQITPRKLSSVVMGSTSRTSPPSPFLTNSFVFPPKSPHFVSLFSFLYSRDVDLRRQLVRSFLSPFTCVIVGQRVPLRGSRVPGTRHSPAQFLSSETQYVIAISSSHVSNNPFRMIPKLRSRAHWR
jgi:hypothetical protein